MSDQKQMPRWGFEQGLFFRDGELSPSVIPMEAQANLCADYHAAVEKVLEVCKPHNYKLPRQVWTALSELSAVHEKAKGLL